MPRPRRWAPSSSSSRRRMPPMPTTPPTRATPTSRTSAACKPRPSVITKGLPGRFRRPFFFARPRPRSRPWTMAIPAATLIVVRDRPDGPPELLMVERSEGMAFAAGALVFPGGRIDAADVRLLGPNMRGARSRQSARPSRKPRCRSGLAPLPDRETVLELQSELAREGDFAALAVAGRAAARPGGADAVRALGPEIPRRAPVRHDVLRRAAARRANGSPMSIEHECAGAHWLSARDALERAARGEAAADLPDPAQSRAARPACRSSRKSGPTLLRTRSSPSRPWVEEREGEKFITIPAHLGYPVTEERLDGLWRG